MMARHRGQTAQGGPFDGAKGDKPRRGRQAFCHCRGRCDSAPGMLDRDAAMTDRTFVQPVSAGLNLLNGTACSLLQFANSDIA
jgi:hypothetical protein